MWRHMVQGGGTWERYATAYLGIFQNRFHFYQNLKLGIGLFQRFGYVMDGLKCQNPKGRGKISKNVCVSYR